LVDAAPRAATLPRRGEGEHVNETLVELAKSVAFVAFMIAVAAWARIARPVSPLDERARGPYWRVNFRIARSTSCGSPATGPG